MAWADGMWLWAWAAGFLLWGGLVVVLTGLFRDRSRGRQRCPRCWYRLEGVPRVAGMVRGVATSTVTCPECGERTRGERRLMRTRRRWWLVVAGLVMMALSPQFREQPTRVAIGETWTRAIPTFVAAVGLEVDDDAWRDEVRQLLSARLSTCNRFDRTWIRHWRDRSVKREWHSQLTHRTTVVAGHEFWVGLKSPLTIPQPTPGAHTVFTKRYPVDPQLTAWQPLREAMRSHVWRVDMSGPDGETPFATWMRAPVRTGPAALRMPLSQFSSAVGELVNGEVDLAVDVVATMDEAVSPRTDKAFEEEMRKWTRLNVLHDGGRWNVHVYYMGAARSEPVVVRCVLLRDGVEVARSNTPLLPRDERWTRLPLTGANAKELAAELAGELQSEDTAQSRWSLRLEGDPAHVYRSGLHTWYWSGSIEMPARTLRR